MFSSFKLSSKMAFGFGVVLAALIAIVAVSYTVMGSAEVVVSDLSGTHIPLLNAVAAFDSALNAQELAVTQYAVHGDEDYLRRYEEIDTAVDQHLTEARKLVTADEELVAKGWPANVDAIAEAHDRLFVTACTALIEAVKAGKPYEEWDPLADEVVKASEAVMAKIDELLELNINESNRVASNAESGVNRAKFTIMVVGAAALLVGALLAVLITLGITRPINRVSSELNAGAEQVASAASQVSVGSQQSAEGASEQAAAIEETSSSLEEISSMTRQNADNAAKANSLMGEAKQTVGRVAATIQDLSDAMDSIAVSGREIGKLIRAIDEIAFQTNLLALNASVEAARAGESGAGFAIVADEVRNLAHRAAEAAKNSAGMIAGTVSQIERGAGLVKTTDDAFMEMAEQTAKVGSLVAEIAAANQTQARGIEQINQAISQMDKMVQTGAAGAEESASAAEEMNAMADTMQGVVLQLMATINGSRCASGSARPAIPQPALPEGRRPAIEHFSARRHVGENHPGTRQPPIFTANEVIPLEEDNLEDF